LPVTGAARLPLLHLTDASAEDGIPRDPPRKRRVLDTQRPCDLPQRAPARTPGHQQLDFNRTQLARRGHNRTVPRPPFSIEEAAFFTVVDTPYRCPGVRLDGDGRVRSHR